MNKYISWRDAFSLAISQSAAILALLAIGYIVLHSLQNTLPKISEIFLNPFSVMILVIIFQMLAVRYSLKAATYNSFSISIKETSK